MVILTAIAKSVGTTIGSIVTWLAADPERSARDGRQTNDPTVLG
jgi:hypothetical protein